MNFEWDEEKNRENQRKHGIPFEYAMLVFEDDFRLEEYDYRHDEEEDRYNIIGRVDEIIFVVCTYKDEDVIRIISARQADKDERRQYEWQWSEEHWKASRRK